VNTIHATAWVNGSTTAIDLGNLNGRGSFAYGVSADDRLAISRTTLTLEMNAARKVSKHGTLSLGAGLEHDFSADRATLTGTSDLVGIQDFSISGTVERRKTRGFATVAYTHDFGNNRALTSSLRVGQSTFGSDPQVRAGISFAMGF
jgi:hypothetical protein